MILSMTGFGKAVTEIPGKKFTVEIKSLNSKQLDVMMRVPQSLKAMELEIRNHIAATLERGKVDIGVFVESTGSEAFAKLDVEVLRSYKEQLLNVSRELEIPEPTDWYATLLRLPDVFRNDNSSEIGEEEKEALMECVDKAIEHLMDFRAQEGRKLDEFFRKRIARIGELLAEVPKYEMERITKIRARITDNLSQIPQVEYDRGRLEQEMIFYIEKLDINEEKQRLANHLSYFLETMDGPAGQGKKLGFISQEMGREINTLGSKSNQAEMQRLVVKMKDELEQIKEQVLNAM